MRADRLLSILLLLQNHGKMTSRELSDKLEVSERTIMRDMEALSSAGVPVYAERGSTGGWVLSENYRTNLTGMKSEEILSLLISGQTDLVGELGIGKHFDNAFQKLLASSPDPIRQNAEMARQRIHIDGAGWHQSKESVPFLSMIQEAVWEERILSIRYARENDIVERTVSPLGLVAKRTIWYLVAQVEGEMRTYRISRLLDARIRNESFERPVDFNLARFWDQSTEQFKMKLPRYPATVKINKTHLSRFEQERYAKILGHHPAEDGWVEAEVDFQVLESACEIILGFGAAVEVLTPMELRMKVIAEAKAILQQYGGN